MGGQHILKSVRMLLLRIRAETVIAPLQATPIGLCLHYLHENQENNRIKVGEGLKGLILIEAL